MRAARIARALFALLVLGTLVAVWRGRAEERHIAELVRDADPPWLVVVVMLQALTYAALATAWSFSIRRAGARPPGARALLRLGLAELFTNQAIPAVGVGGTLLVVAGLRRRGVPGPAAATAVVAGFLGFYLAQLAAVLGALAIMASRGLASGFVDAMLVVALVVAVVAPTVTIAAVTGTLRFLPHRLQRLGIVRSMRDAVLAAPRTVVLSPRMLLPVAGSRVAILVCDGATLAASLAAVGHPVRADVVIAVFVVAQVAASITFLPGGVGSFEAAAVALLVSIGVPLEAAVPATLVMRAFDLWIPMLPGLVFARAELRGAPA